MSQENKVVFLKGKKVILRPLSKADIPTLLRWINDPEVNQYVATYWPVMEQREEKWLESLAKEDNDSHVVFGIETHEGVFIGTMGFNFIQWKDRVAVTGALIGEKEYWGKGYGTDAKMILLEYAFNTLNMHKVCSAAIAFNERSIRYSLRCGYKIEGRLRKHHFRKGRYFDQVMLAIFKQDWLKVWRRYQKTGKVR
ncbi:N-acetyltransferase [Candidatus Parcubacteria bacterium]|nr:MAG: N-acetyltransferase [Candidatus Parcubacteria bacterium]